MLIAIAREQMKRINLCGTINNNALSKLIGKMPDKYDIDYSIYVQVRKHKKKRINKKWAKRYGYKCVTKPLKVGNSKHIQMAHLNSLNKECTNGNSNNPS